MGISSNAKERRPKLKGSRHFSFPLPSHVSPSFPFPSPPLPFPSCNLMQSYAMQSHPIMLSYPFWFTRFWQKFCALVHWMQPYALFFAIRWNACNDSFEALGCWSTLDIDKRKTMMGRAPEIRDQVQCPCLMIMYELNWTIYYPIIVKWMHDKTFDCYTQRVLVHISCMYVHTSLDE